MFCEPSQPHYGMPGSVSIRAWYHSTSWEGRFSDRYNGRKRLMYLDGASRIYPSVNGRWLTLHKHVVVQVLKNETHK